MAPVAVSVGQTVGSGSSFVVGGSLHMPSSSSSGTNGTSGSESDEAVPWASDVAPDVAFLPADAPLGLSSTLNSAAPASGLGSFSGAGARGLGQGSRRYSTESEHVDMDSDDESDSSSSGGGEGGGVESADALANNTGGSAEPEPPMPLPSASAQPPPPVELLSAEASTEAPMEAPTEAPASALRKSRSGRVLGGVKRTSSTFAKRLVLDWRSVRGGDNGGRARSVKDIAKALEGAGGEPAAN